MFAPVKISPSILSADFLCLGAEVDAVSQAGADWIHVDVMDGHFVPNTTIGVPFVHALRPRTQLPIDVHLMVSNPLEQLPWFIQAGADYLTVHWEALDASNRADAARQAANVIHQAERRAGVSIKPDTPVSNISGVLDVFDMVLVMSVYPGFSGQSYIPESADRVAQVVQECRKLGCAPLIQVDGGIGPQTAALVAAQGADVLVAGNAVFKGESYVQAIDGIRAMAEQARLSGLQES